MFSWSLNGFVSVAIEEQASGNYFHADFPNAESQLEVRGEQL